MKPHLQYLWFMVRHKWFVFLAGGKTGAPLWRLIIHDWSKFTRAEWTPYVNNFYVKPRDAAQRAVFQYDLDLAWLHHQKWNKHHWQYWVLREDDGQTKYLEIPSKYVREMVADWMGAGRAITGKWETAEWYTRNAQRIHLSAHTRIFVEELLGLRPVYLDKD